MNLSLNLSVEAAIEIALSTSISTETRQSVENALMRAGHSRKLFMARMQQIKALRLEISKHISQ